jgi:hypothetical protein
MKRTGKLWILAALAAVVVLSMVASPVTAISNGVPDGENHPYVCIVLFYDAYNNPMWRTSGSLIADDVVLTAGHGTFGTAYARVWFETDIRGTDYPYADGDPTTSIKGEVYTHPDYWATPQGNGLPGFDYHDVGIVVLEKDAPVGIVPADLPEAGVVATLRNKRPVDLVGYGVQWQEHGDGFKPYDAWVWNGMRFYAPAQYIASSDVMSAEFMKLTANPGQGKGGTAYGDSGSPILKGGTNTILGICTFGTNPNCAGLGYAQRIDMPDILNWLNGGYKQS